MGAVQIFPHHAKLTIKVIEYREMELHEYLNTDPIKGLCDKHVGEVLLKEGFKPLIWISNTKLTGIWKNQAYFIDIGKSLLEKDFSIKLGELPKEIENLNVEITVASASVLLDNCESSGMLWEDVPRITFKDNQETILDVLLVN